MLLGVQTYCNKFASTLDGAMLRGMSYIQKLLLKATV